MKYYVDLLKTVCLDRVEVEAKSKKEAKEKAYNKFNKFDLNDYDTMEVITSNPDEEELDIDDEE